MTKRLTMLMGGLVLSTGMALAQTTVTGKVVSQEDGEPVIGASVKIAGTKTGTVTDVDGNFILPNASKDAVLEITYLGMETQKVKASAKMKIVLVSDSKNLDEVVVTAMGITRNEKTLGYAATTVKSDEIVGARTTNVADALSGKVAGVQVNATSADPGSVSNVVIRGYGSINGSNQPLYVVDGVPLQNNMVSGQGKNISTGGISNISPEDIASMTVLKGAAATALYGSRAANGVILITTKTGAKGQARNYTINYSGSVQARMVSCLPDMQNSFGQGWNGRQTFIENGSWGPALDGSLQVYGPEWNHQQLLHPYKALKNNVKDFFEEGWSQNHNVSLSGVSKSGEMTYYLSYSYTGDDGIMPGDKDTYKRNTLAFRNTYQANDWCKLSSSFNFARSATDAVGNFQGTSVVDGLYELPRDVSLLDKKDLSSPFNTPEAYFTPYGITNPYWALANNYNHTDAKQINGKIQADINPIKDLTLTYRFGFDYTDYDSKTGYPQIALDDKLITDDKGYAPSHMNQSGYVWARYGRTYEFNHDFMANYKKKFFDDKLDLAVIAGVNMNERSYTHMTGEADDLTFETGFWQLSNGATKKTLSEYQTKRRLIGAFGDVTLGWNDMLYLDLTARNDWSSTLPIDKNSFFYPGATLSWIFSKVIPENKVLTFGKARVAYGKTGNDADPYLTGASYSQASIRGYYDLGISKFPMNGKNSFLLGNTKGSNSLKPEMTTEIEVGLNLQFFMGRIGLDASFYNRTTDDQIFTLPVDPATGYYYQVTNFGSVRNRGVELLLTTVPVQTKNFKWELGFNFSKNWNKVLEMPASLEGGRVSIYDYSSGNDAVYMYAEEGKPMGEFYTYLPQYTEDGKVIVDANGQPVIGTQVEDTGKNMNSDWTGGVTTALTYKGFTLSAALDVRKGGYMFSRTKNLMQFTGNGTITTYNDRRPFIIPNSVVKSGDTYVENTTPIYQTDGSYQKYYNDYGYGNGGEAYLLDRSYVKLRNISLTWNLPRLWTSKLSLSNVALTVFCNNVFTWTASSNTFIDPETTTISQSSYGDLATQFGEMYSNPSCRTFGANLSVTF